jgi:hypothetical protein
MRVLFGRVDREDVDGAEILDGEAPRVLNHPNHA